MPQQTSPFLEGKYGWNFGESGWNTGMDENLLKFSYMFDRNVDGIVSSLPAAVNGQAYFLTTDNRLYFAVGNTWYSSPVPKWFEFKIRSTGDVYQFNGTSVVQIESPANLDARLDAIELTVSTLGSAAFEDVSAFATTEELDVVEGQAQTYTDTLRSDLANASDPAKGAGMVAYKNPLDGAIARSLFDKAKETVSILDFGPPGTIGVGNASADTAAFIAACSTGKSNPVTVHIPAGTYRLNGTVDVHSYTNLIGAGRWQVDIVCEHSGPVFNYLPGDNAPLNINQGGDNIVCGMTIRREELPSARIPGNYGIKMPATFGMTVLEDLDFANMGDSNIYYEDVANPSVGSGSIFLRNIKMISLWGWLVEFRNLFAQIYLDGLTSVRSGGGLYFDGSAGTATFRGFNLSIRNTNIESCGLGPGGNLSATPGPAVYVKRQHCVVIDNCYLSTHDNNYGPVVHLDDVTTADISASTAMVSHGDTGAGCLLLTGGCGRIDVGRSTLLEGLDKADYAIRSVGTSGLAIRNPRMTGFTGNQLELSGVGSNFPVLVESGPTVSVLTQDYSGSLSGAASAHVQTKQLADQRGVAKYLYLGAISAGTLSVLSATGVSVSRTGAGVFQVTFSVARDNSVYVPEISVQSETAMSVTYSNPTVSGFVVRTFDASGAPADPVRLSFAVYADR